MRYRQPKCPKCLTTIEDRYAKTIGRRFCHWCGWEGSDEEVNTNTLIQGDHDEQE